MVGVKEIPSKFVLLVDRGDAHGLSIALAAAYLNARSSRQISILPSLLGEVASKKVEIEQALRALKANTLIVADLPIPGHDEEAKKKTIDVYRELVGKGYRVVFVDHHPMPQDVKQALQEAGVEVHVFNSGAEMSDFLLEHVFRTPFIAELKRVLYVGNLADLDCRAFESVGELDRLLAYALDGMLRTYGWAGALAVATAVMVHGGAIGLAKYSDLYEALLYADELKDKGERVDGVLVFDYRKIEDVMKSGWLNKAVNVLTSEGFAEYVIVTSQRYDVRSSKYTSALLVYTDPCGDVRSKLEKLREEMPELSGAKIVGHKSFSIVILEAKDKPEELMPADKLYELAKKVAERLAGR
ncbi:MAG: hypothetical protein ABGW50_02130 [Thermococcus sp.]